jgi:hypothetical protein
MRSYMLKVPFIGFTFYLFILLSPSSAIYCTQFAQFPSNYYPAFEQSSYRAFSVTQAQQSLRGKETDKKIIRQIQSVGGITRICGFVFDEKTNEVILHGIAENGVPEMTFDDFVVILRNVWLKYAQRTDNTITYTYPGCSIDPDPDVLGKLRTLEAEIMGLNDTQQVEKVVKKWMQTCKEPQAVRVLGMPFNCNVAKVLVDADYHMKRVTDGTDSLGIPGLESYSSMMLEDAKRCALSGKPLSVVSTSNRFWFYPGNLVVEKKDNSYLLTDCEVILLTELQYARQSENNAFVDRYAERFAADFTALFDQIADKRPIYRQLEQEFQLVAVAKAIYEERSGSIYGLDYLLNEYPVVKSDVAPRLAGNPSIRRFSHTTQTGNVIHSLSLRQPSCGGVAINAEPKIKEGPADAVGLAVTRARPSLKAVTWECPGPATAMVVQRYRAKKLNKGASSAALQIRNSEKGYSLIKNGLEVTSNDGRIFFSEVPELFFLIQKHITGFSYESVCIESIGFTPDKLEALATSLRTQVWLNDKKGQVRILPIEAASGRESAYMLEMLLSPGIRYYKEEKNDIVSIENDPSLKGFYSTTLRFAGQIGKNIKQFSLDVIGKTKEIVLDFVGVTNRQFVDSNSFSGSFSDLAVKIRKELAAKRSISEGELLLQLKDELGNTQCVFIIRMNGEDTEVLCRAQ